MHSVRYLSPLFVEQRVCIGNRIEQTFKVDLYSRRQELLLVFSKSVAEFEYFTDNSLELKHRTVLKGKENLAKNTHACTEGMVVIDRKTNDTIGIATSVPIACILSS